MGRGMGNKQTPPKFFDQLWCIFLLAIFGTSFMIYQWRGANVDSYMCKIFGGFSWTCQGDDGGRRLLLEDQGGAMLQAVQRSSQRKMLLPPVSDTELRSSEALSDVAMEETTSKDPSETGPQMRAQDEKKLQIVDEVEESNFGTTSRATVGSDDSGNFEKANGREAGKAENLRGWDLHAESHRVSGADGKCMALKEQHHYYPESLWTSSPALLIALRRYEKLHKDCVFGVASWRSHFQKLQPGYEHCKYIIYEDHDAGLGNRLSGLVGAFAYALMTDRVLLLQHTYNLDDLLCNPFPESSWWLPSEFPIDDLLSSPHHGEYIYANATHNPSQKNLGRRDMVNIYMPWWMAEGHDTEFFCNKMQEQLADVTWTYYTNVNLNIISPIWLVQAWQKRLFELFPDRRMVTPLARYLLLPTNVIWQQVKRTFDTYMRHSHNIVGIQIRTHNEYNSNISTRVIQCMEENDILWPSEAKEDHAVSSTQGEEWSPVSTQDSQLILVASMSYNYYHDMRHYFGNSEAALKYSNVAVHTESQEHKEDHRLSAGRHALTEMWLLSFSHTLLVSTASTFGAIPDALAGRDSVYRMNICEHVGYSEEVQWRKNGKAVCERSRSPEGCFMGHMQFNVTCAGDWLPFKSKDASQWYPHITTCQDYPHGLLLIPKPLPR